MGMENAADHIHTQCGELLLILLLLLLLIMMLLQVHKAFEVSLGVLHIQQTSLPPSPPNTRHHGMQAGCGQGVSHVAVFV